MMEFVLDLSQNIPSLLCPDWVVTREQSHHSAQNAGWFNDYQPFSSIVIDTKGNELRVVGIGTVSLPVQRSSSSKESCTILELHNVLHIPGSVCNVIGTSIAEQGFNIDSPTLGRNLNVPRAGGIINLWQERVAYFIPSHRFHALKICEPPIGPNLGRSGLKDGVLYSVSTEWPMKERAAWSNRQVAAIRKKKFHQSLEGRQQQPRFEQPLPAHSALLPMEPVQGDYPLQQSEIDWAVKHYGTLTNFMQMQMIDLNEPQQAADGRFILRTLINALEPGNGDGPFSELIENGYAVLHFPAGPPPVPPRPGSLA